MRHLAVVTGKQCIICGFEQRAEFVSFQHFERAVRIAYHVCESADNKERIGRRKRKHFVQKFRACFAGGVCPYLLAVFTYGIIIPASVALSQIIADKDFIRYIADIYDKISEIFGETAHRSEFFERTVLVCNDSRLFLQNYRNEFRYFNIRYSVETDVLFYYAFALAAP